MRSSEQLLKEGEEMRKGTHIPVTIIIGICLASMTGCGSQEPKAQQIPDSLAASEPGTDSPDRMPGDAADNTADPMSDKIPDNKSDRESAESFMQEDDQGSREETPGEPCRVPTLPDTGTGLTDFVPEGWTLMDSVELDFNEDQVPDYVGVLERTLSDPEHGDVWDDVIPRILFAIASDGAGGYDLDFQDMNLIRTRAEGGVFGDPYEPLTAEGTSFTTHAYGGSAWKWSEANTYTWDEGTWYRTMSENTYGYGPFVTSYEKDDWERGVGIRKERSDDFDEMEKYWDSDGSWDEERFDVEYEISLDEPLTLCQAGAVWWLAPKRVADWSVESIGFSADTELSEDRVKRPDEAYPDYCDQDCVLYAFPGGDGSSHYLAMYRFEGRELTVLAESDGVIGGARLYRGKLYYFTEIVEEVAYKQTQGQGERIVEEEDVVGIRLNRMNPDGSGKETIFEYEYPEADQEILESRLPYLSLIYELSGDEVIAEVYIGNRPHPVYRMNSDGSGLRWIGQIPAVQTEVPAATETDKEPLT